VTGRLRSGARYVAARALGLIASPRREWAAIAAADESTSAVLFRYVVPLAAIPAVAWEIGLGVFGLGAFHGEPVVAATARSPLAGAAATVLGAILCVATLARSSCRHRTSFSLRAEHLA
jgi:hypothetical protein